MANIPNPHLLQTRVTFVLGNLTCRWRLFSLLAKSSKDLGEPTVVTTLEPAREGMDKNGRLAQDKGRAHIFLWLLILLVFAFKMGATTFSA